MIGAPEAQVRQAKAQQMQTLEEPEAVITYRFPYVYYVYGISLYSEIPLPLPNWGRGELAQIALRVEPASYFANAVQDVPLEQPEGSWFKVGRLADGSSYVRWETVGEFLVSPDGLQVRCRQFDLASTESFQVYLLGQALSFALVNRGFEPIHATVVVVNGEAVVFLGDSGFGKSTLAASFVSAGYPVLTDDLLILQPGTDRVLAYPGPARIKLFPKAARQFLGDAASGIRMNPDTEKLILPLDRKQVYPAPVPVKAIYALAPPREVFRKQSIRIETLSPRESFLELVKNTFNRRIVDSGRLTRQLQEMSRLVDHLPVQRLSIPRDLDRLPLFREAIIEALNARSLEAVVCGD